MASNIQRRQILVESMASKEKLEIHCFNCEGNCCTYSHNSMQITPLETLDLLAFLDLENRINIELMDKLKGSLLEFRLDKELGNGKKALLRRNYTCPFFMNSNKGCSISRFSKPYGCLGFNPQEKGLTSPTNCHSEQELLEEQNITHNNFENTINSEIKDEFKLWWDKLPIPYAIIEILKFNKKEDLLSYYEKVNK